MNEFALGAGFTAEQLADLINKILAAVILLWAAYVVVGAFLGFIGKSLEGYQVFTFSFRGALVVLVMLWLLAL